MFQYTKIKSIKPIGEQIVYDISVAEDESYLAEGFINHNSRDPNLQNIPNRTQSKFPEVQDIFKRVKKFFSNISDKYVIMQADYSQAELRSIANFSGDESMQDAYLTGKDLHVITGSKIARLELEDFEKLKETDEFKFSSIRGFAKNANFCLIYNATLKTYIEYVKDLSGVILNQKEAEWHQDSLFKAYPKLKEWHRKYVDKARKYGYVRTLFGRKRRLLNIHNTDKSLRAADERVAINMPIQGTCGEWTMFVVAVLGKILPKDVIFFNTVHDAIYYYIPKKKLKLVIELMKDISANPPIDVFFGVDKRKFKVPMKLDFGMSEKAWGYVEDEKDYYKNKVK